MTIERGLRHIEASRQGCGRYLFPARSFQHRCQRLQDLQTPLAWFARHSLLPGSKLPCQSALIIVPTPSLVSTSSSSACSTRPSMICELFTPFFTASSAEPIFGSIPPWIVPSANNASISLAESPVSSFPCLSSTPTVLVISTSFSAFSVSASLPATRSALML